MVAESARSPDGETPGMMFQIMGHGWTSQDAFKIWSSHIASGEYQKEPIFRSIQAFVSRRGMCGRDQAVDNQTWSAAPVRNEIFRSCEIDEFLATFHDLPGGERQSFISLYRPLGDGAFRRRDRRLVRLFHQELARHFGAALATLDDPSPAGLTPRLRDTLRCLLEGDSEKQAALRLGLSTLTVHQYVKALYRHFRVSSRPELMAYFLRRSGFRLE
jgi:DNA-binding CsgD family transcriptional regulator